MLMAVRIVRWLVRALFALMLLLGLLFWTGHATALVPLHILLGLALVVCLIFLAAAALARRAPPALPVLLIVWALVLPVFGLAQGQLLTGGGHWIVQVLHLLLGAGAVGFSEALAARTVLSRTQIQA
jgi:hypothetical protein